MISVSLYQRNKKFKDDTQPIVLRITHNRKTNIVSLNFKCKKEDWNPLREEFRKSYPNYKENNHVIQLMKNKADKIIRQFFLDEIDFDFEKFKNEFLNVKEKKKKVNEFWDEQIDNLKFAGREGNARYYLDCKNTFFKFLNNKTISFDEINFEMLENYENFLRNRNCKPSGIAVRMRGLRAIYNSALKKEYISFDNYPFKNYKISKLKGMSDKRAIKFDEILKIRSLDLSENPELVNSKNYFIFSYYARGMNFHDMLLLKWENILEDTFSYYRHKTGTRFVISISDYLKEIINYYKANNNGTKYVFPILLNDKMTPLQIENRKHKTLSKYNKDLKILADLSGIETKLTSYVARHSFATNLKEKGISTDIISEAMGHADLSITQAYLKDFENNVIEDAIKCLV